MDDQIMGHSSNDKNVDLLALQRSDHNDGVASKSMSSNVGPRLNVPKILVINDKTPTPTKLLQAVDEIGLFQDEDEDEEHRLKKVDMLKDRLVGNPFDEHFRKAAQMQKGISGGGNDQNQQKVEIYSKTEKKVNWNTLKRTPVNLFAPLFRMRF
jgi:hypothetical protein